MKYLMHLMALISLSAVASEELAIKYAKKIGSRNCSVTFEAPKMMSGARIKFEKALDKISVNLTTGPGSMPGLVNSRLLIKEFVNGKVVWQADQTYTDVAPVGTRRDILVDPYSRQITLKTGNNQSTHMIKLGDAIPLYFIPDATGKLSLVFIDSMTNTGSRLIDCGL